MDCLIKGSLIGASLSCSTMRGSYWWSFDKIWRTIRF